MVTFVKMVSSEDLYLNRAKFVMKHLGIWVPVEDESVFSKAYKAFMMTLQYSFLIFQIIYAVQVWGDLDEVSQASCVLFTQACLCLKVTIFLRNMDMFKELLRLMDQELFRPENAEQEEILKLQAVRIKRLLLSFMVASQMTCGIWALKPLFDDPNKFPFDMWMPVSPESTVQYFIGYTFQMVTICTSAYMYFGVDSFAFSSIIFGCAQIDIIKEKIMRITSVVGKPGSSEVAQALSENYKKLVNCIKHYQAIISFKELVENAYHPYLLFQIVGSVGIICMSALRMFIVDWHSMQFMSILMYMVVMTSQLFVCCWCGHELTATSEDLHTVLYKSIWYEQDLKFKRDLCFAMMSMSRPLVLRTGHYIQLSRQTFVAILRMSYSYFVVLNQTK